MATAFTRKPRNPGTSKHISRQDSLRPGQIMSDADQRKIEELWKEGPTEVIVYRPGDPAFDSLASMYQVVQHNNSQEFTDFRIGATR